jgi:hypothetical protein
VRANKLTRAIPKNRFHVSPDLLALRTLRFLEDLPRGKALLRLATPVVRSATPAPGHLSFRWKTSKHPSQQLVVVLDLLPDLSKVNHHPFLP